MFDDLLFSGEKPAGLHFDQTSDSNQFKTHLGTGQTMTFFQYGLLILDFKETKNSKFRPLLK